MDTIFALSSGPLPAGVAVIRVSGPLAGLIIEESSGGLPPARQASYRSIRDRNGEIVDRGLVIWFPGPASFTGEDCAELHLHGGRAVVERMLETLAAFPDCRMAEAGEFSRRAFANGKFDLTAAEGLADLIAAQTEAQRLMALAQSSGALADIYDGWQKRVLHGRAMIEAEIDFADEEDVPGSVSSQVWRDMEVLRGEIARHLEGQRRGAAVREGFRIAIVGAPNAGKSSLMNALAGSDVAIVSDEPGTTRDAIEIRLSIGGHLAVVIDTAGIREGAGAVEAEGIRRAFRRAEDADLVLYLSDSGTWPMVNELKTSSVWRLASKDDLGGTELDSDTVRISVRTPDGLNVLLSRLAQHLAEHIGKDMSSLPSRQRHADNLRVCLQEIDAALEGDALEIRAESLRRAAYSLGQITGQHGVEDILGVIFSEFCIGK